MHNIFHTQIGLNLSKPQPWQGCAIMPSHGLYENQAETF